MNCGYCLLEHQEVVPITPTTDGNLATCKRGHVSEIVAPTTIEASIRNAIISAADYGWAAGRNNKSREEVKKHANEMADAAGL